MLQTAFGPSCMNRASVFEWQERFKEGREDVMGGRSKEVNTPQLIGQTVRVTMLISTRTMHQSTTPSLSQTIWPRWPSRQFLTLPIVQTLLHVTFAYSLSSRKNLEAVIMRQLRRWKRLWRRSLTWGLPWSLSEVVGPVQQVHCSRRRLLRKGLEFHVCTINKSAHTKKVGKLI